MPVDVDAIDHKVTSRLWKLATGHGTEGATTSFTSEFNKDRASERPYALGYLKKIKFLRFCQTEVGKEVVGIDMSKAGAGGGEREGLIRRVCSEFFELCVFYSNLCEAQEDDYENVGNARSMGLGSFTIYQGFAAAIHSTEFTRLRTEWLACDILPPPAQVVAPVAPAETPTAETPTTETTKPTKRDVVDMDASDDDDEAKPSVYTSPKPSRAASPAPAPAPASKPASKKRKLAWTESTVSTETAHWDIGSIGSILLKEFERYKHLGVTKRLIFDSKSCHYGAVLASEYQVLVKQRQMGTSALKTDGYVGLAGLAKVRAGVGQLRSTKEIARFFNFNPDLNGRVSV